MVLNTITDSKNIGLRIFRVGWDKDIEKWLKTSSLKFQQFLDGVFGLQIESRVEHWSTA